MPFAITSEHREFFFKHQFVEFEELIDQKDISPLREAIFQQLGERLHKKDPKKECSIKELYLEGRNLFADHPLIRKFVLKRDFAEVVVSLLNARSLRIAFDQLIATNNHLDKLLPKTASLKQISSLEPLICGLIINLTEQCNLISPQGFSLANEIQTLVPIPHLPGSGIFFTPDLPISFSDLFSTPNQDLLLIAYGGDKLLYNKNDDDPHVHYLKKLGYVFGDKMKNTTHPIISVA